MARFPEASQYNYDANWLPETFITTTEVSSESIQKLSINHEQIQVQNRNAENQAFTFTNITENTNTSLGVSPNEHDMDTIVHSQPMDSNLNGTTETDFNFRLLDDAPLFSSHTINTLPMIDLENNNNNDYNNNDIYYGNTNNTTTNKDENHKKRQPVKSTEPTHGLDSLNTIPKFISCKKNLYRVYRDKTRFI